MTCIAAVAQGGKVWMAGDSAAVTEWDVMHVAEPKVFTVGPFVMGVAGNSGVRFAQALRYLLEVPERPSGDDLSTPTGDTRWLVREVLPAVRSCLAAAGFLKRESDVERVGDDANALIGYRGRLYQLDPNLQLVALAEPYAALGSGCEVALGSLHTSAYAALPPEWRVRYAVSAAAAHARGVREPVNVESIG